jgi:hypothetical protein
VVNTILGSRLRMERDIQLVLTRNLDVQIEIVAAKGDADGMGKMLEKLLHRIVSVETPRKIDLSDEKGRTPLKFETR